MGSGRGLRRRAGAVASAAVLTLASGALAVAASTSPGYPATDLSLHDGGVWVTGVRDQVVGLVGPEIRQQVMALPSFGSVAFDVVQDGALVLVRDDDKRVLRRVDVPGRRFTGPGAALPPSATVAAGAGTVAVLDPSSGALWVRPAATAAEQAFVGAAPAVTLGPDAAMTVDVAGTVRAITPRSKELVSVSLAGDRPVVERREVGEIPNSVRVAITAVGTSPVLLVDGRTLVVPGHDRLAVPGRTTGVVQAAGEAQPAGTGDPAGPVLQQPSASGDAVLVQTGDALYSVPFDGSAPRTLAGGVAAGSPGAVTGTVAEPVSIGGCSYAVWSGGGTATDRAATVATGCGTAVSKLQQVGSAPGARLRLRVNRSRVVLNDPDTGDTFVPEDPKVSIAQWRQVNRARADKDAETEAESSEKVVVADRRAANHPPRPQPDAFGVRPGATVVLPVLGNDSDPDGDVLVARTAADAVPESFGRVQTVDSGRALQFTAAARSGSRTVAYTVDDGRAGGTAAASLKLTLVPAGVNTAPRARGAAPVVSVGRSGRVSYDVLGDWVDDESDPLTLTCPGAGEAVRCSPDGTLTYTDPGRRLGQVRVPVQVGDGRAVTSGSVLVDVVADRAPLVRPDFAVGVAGVATVIRPLADDTGYGSDPLQLTRVVPTDATARVSVAADGAVTLTPSSPGTVYLTYQVRAGRSTGTGIVRVDVAAGRGGRAPVPAPDSVVVRPLVPRVVDVLANDSDPDGDVVVVTGASVTGAPATSSAGLAVEVLRHHTVRVTAGAEFAGPATVRYTVSDGAHEAVGTLLVRRAPDGAVNAAPTVVDDVASVRAGQVATVDVLANDSDPEGEPLGLDPQVRAVSFRPDGARQSQDRQAQDQGSPAKVLAFTGPEVVRVVAPDRPGRVTLTYTARDAQGQPASASVTLVVTPEQGPDAPPVPRGLEARAVAGRPASVVVPLIGIDPDGDPVRLLPPARQPSLGVVELDPDRADALRYTPRPGSSGTDTVRYQVIDALGATGTATLRIGVAPPAAGVQPPVAVDDRVAVRNDRARHVQVAVLSNDTSGPGDPISLVPDRPVTPVSPGARARVQGPAVVVDVPAGATSPVMAAYRIQAGGMEAVSPGLLTVTPRADAPLLAPLARDDVAPSGGLQVDVPVLRNDVDPDGSPADLRIPAGADAVGPPALATRRDDRTVRVTRSRTDRWAWYTVTDPDGLTARALVLVPGTGPEAGQAPAVDPPRLRRAAPAFVVRDGETRTLSLRDYVESPAGRAVRLTDTARVSGSGVTVRATSVTAIAVTGTAAYGRGGVTFEVMDGTGPGAAGVHRVYLTVPVTVLGKDNRAPRLRPLAATVSRAPGAAPAVLDLEAATDDDPTDAGRHTYRVTGTTGGVTAALAGARLTVRPGSAPAAGTGQVTVQVSDGRATSTGSVAVTVTGGAAAGAPPSAADCSPAGGQLVDPGAAFTVDLSRCVVTAGAPAAVTVTGTAGASATVSGLSARVSVAAGTTGPLALPYTVRDTVGRSATARIVARAVGRPTAPGAPQPTGTLGAGGITLRWTPADPRGGTVTEYRVAGGAATGFTQTCPGDATQCRLTGLSTTTAYTFTVSAVNERGEGPASPPSATLRADVPPAQPSGLTATPGDGSVRLAWTGSDGGGSPVTGYEVTVSPPTSGGQTEVTVTGGAGPAGTTVGGLTNGTGYTFTVRARNGSSAGLGDPASVGPVVPAGAPKPPPAPGVTITPGSGGGPGTARVTWDPAAVRAAANGPFGALQVITSFGGPQGVDVGAGAATMGVPSQPELTFSLEVSDAAGRTARGPATTVSAALPPARPVIDAVTDDKSGQSVTLSFTLGAAGSGTYESVLVSWSGAGSGSRSVSPPSGGSGTYVIGGLSPGEVEFTVRACNSATLCTTSDARSVTVTSPAAATAGPISLAQVGSNLVATYTATFRASVPAGIGDTIHIRDVTGIPGAAGGEGELWATCQAEPPGGGGTCEGSSRPLQPGHQYLAEHVVTGLTMTISAIVTAQ